MKKHFALIRILCFAGTCFFATSPARSQIVQFGDRATFNAAVATPLTTIDFESLAPSGAGGYAVNDDLTLSGVEFLPLSGDQYILASPSVFGQGDGSTYLFDTSLAVLLPVNIYAVGTDLFTNGVATGYASGTVSDSDGNAFRFTSTLPQHNGFLGFIDETPGAYITSIVFNTPVAAAGGGNEIDNFSFAGITQVPEPISLATFGMGLLVVAIASFRRLQVG